MRSRSHGNSEKVLKMKIIGNFKINRSLFKFKPREVRRSTGGSSLRRTIFIEFFKVDLCLVSILNLRVEESQTHRLTQPHLNKVARMIHRMTPECPGAGSVQFLSLPNIPFHEQFSTTGPDDEQ